MQDVPAKTMLFAGVSETTRAELDAIERRQQLHAGELIFRQGDAATSLILVVRGLVKVWRVAEDGTPITLALLGPGEPIGTLYASREMPNTANVSAHIRTEILLWFLDPLRRIMDRDPVLFSNISSIVARFATRMIDRLEELATAPVEQRVARALIRSIGLSLPTARIINLPLSRQDVADMSATTLPSVSRIMARWREDGLIGGHRGHIHLLDPARLRDIAGLPPDDEMLEIPPGAS